MVCGEWLAPPLDAQSAEFQGQDANVRRFCLASVPKATPVMML